MSEIVTKTGSALSITSRTRDRAIESFRFIMAMLVVLLHVLPTDPRMPWGMPSWAVLPDALCRAAVPFFFITSGFFFNEKRGLSNTFVSTLRKLAPIYVTWSLIYLLVGLLGPVQWKLSPVMLIQGGYGFHLWFLPALMFGLVTLAASLAAGGWRGAVFVATTIAFVGPILAGYHLVLGIEYPSSFIKLQRQMAAPAFVLIGYGLRRTEVPSIKQSLLFCVVALVAMMIERYFFAFGPGGRTELSADLPLSIFLFGPAVFSLSRSLNRLPWAGRLAHLGAMSLAIYVCHLLFIWLFGSIIPLFPGRTLILFLLSAASATVAAKVLVQNRYTRWFSTVTSSRRQ